MHGQQAAITVSHLSKHFRSVKAVDDISFTVGPGQTSALLGGNGAGKTTTLAMLLGLLLPTAGEIKVLGVDMLTQRYQVLPRMNFSSPYVDLPHRLSVAENLKVYARLYGINRVSERVHSLAADLDLERLLRKPYGDLSAGQRTRVSLAKALLNEPEILLMDEPTASLDPDSADRIRRYLMDYQKATGATVLLASHNMQEVEQLCDRVIMMKKGKIVAQETPRHLVSQYGRANLEQVFLDIARSEAQ